MFCCGLVGLLVPAALILRWKLLGSTFGQLEAVLWPSSIILMGLEGPTQRSAFDIIQFYAIVIAANAVLYCVVGLLMCPYSALRCAGCGLSDNCRTIAVALIDRGFECNRLLSPIIAAKAIESRSS
jgi:hypothetical protein